MTKSVCTEAEEVELVQVCAVAYKLVQVKRVLAALRARALHASVLWLINTLRAPLAHRSFAWRAFCHCIIKVWCKIVFGSIYGMEVPVGKIWGNRSAKRNHRQQRTVGFYFKNPQIFATRNYSLENISGKTYSYLVVTIFVAYRGISVNPTHSCFLKKELSPEWVNISEIIVPHLQQREHFLNIC